MRRWRSSWIQGGVLALVGTLGLVATGHAPPTHHQLTGIDASSRNPAVSAFDKDPVKSATAGCPAGLVVLGTGGWVTNGGGSVLLTSVAPDAGLTSVTARAVAIPGYASPWSVSAFAICGWPDGDPTLVATPTTAKCPDGYLVLGMGFEIPEFTFLTAVMPNAANTAVSVHFSRFGPGTEKAVAYAICIVVAPYLTYHPWVQAYVSGLPDASSPKTVSAPVQNSWVNAVGGQVLPASREVHIDTVMPSLDLMQGTVRAVQLTNPLAKAQLSGGDPWSLVLYETSAYYY